MNDWEMVNNELQRMHLILHKSESAELKVWAINNINRLHEQFLTTPEEEYVYEECDEKRDFPDAHELPSRNP